MPLTLCPFGVKVPAKKGPAVVPYHTAEMNSYCSSTHRSAHSRPIVSRPRLLLYGDPAYGHSTHLAPALLHAMEKLPVHILDLPTLYANSARTPEESCSQVGCNIEHWPCASPCCGCVWIVDVHIRCTQAFFNCNLTTYYHLIFCCALPMVATAATRINHLLLNFR